MRVYFLILLASFLLLSSCTKKEFPKAVVENESDFYFSGTIDNQAVLIKPGKDEYYMYASHGMDTDRIYKFIADLRPANCTNCANSLQIQINDFKTSPPQAAIQIEQSLAPRNYALKGGQLYSVKFASSYNQSAASYLWDFGDKTTSSEPHPTHIYETMGDYKISLRIFGANSCQQYIKSTERIAFPAKNCAITSQNLSANTVALKANPSGLTPNKYLWNFGDGYESDSLNPRHTYAIPGTYPVSLRMIGTNHDTVYSKCNVATITNPMPCLVNYSVTSIAPVLNTAALSRVIITWTDQNGDVYSSNNMLQPTTSYFRIVSVENYDNNEKNEKTKKIKVIFKCNVYDGSRVKTIENAEATVCVSYP